MAKSSKASKVGPRRVPERDEFYLGMAFWVASKSKDPSTQNGAIIISKDNSPLGFGYNGPPKNYDDDDLDWSRENKRPHIIHAEQNAIMWTAAKWCLPGSTMYVTGRPCSVCMGIIAANNIARVVFFPMVRDAGSMMMQDWDITVDVAKRGKVTLVEFPKRLGWMRDRILFFEELDIF